MNEQMPRRPKRVINIGEGDWNADWIKRVHYGLSNARELMIHAKQSYGYAREAGDHARMAQAKREYRAQAERERRAIELCKQNYSPEEQAALDLTPHAEPEMMADDEGYGLEGAGEPLVLDDDFDEYTLDVPERPASDWAWGSPIGKAATPPFEEEDEEDDGWDEDEEDDGEWEDDEGDWDDEEDDGEWEDDEEDWDDEEEPPAKSFLTYGATEIPAFKASPAPAAADEEPVSLFDDPDFLAQYGDQAAGEDETDEPAAEPLIGAEDAEETEDVEDDFENVEPLPEDYDLETEGEVFPAIPLDDVGGEALGYGETDLGDEDAVGSDGVSVAGSEPALDEEEDGDTLLGA